MLAIRGIITNGYAVYKNERKLRTKCVHVEFDKHDSATVYSVARLCSLRKDSGYPLFSLDLVLFDCDV